MYLLFNITLLFQFHITHTAKMQKTPKFFEGQCGFITFDLIINVIV